MHFDAATVALHNVVTDSQSEAYALAGVLGGKERLEEAGQDFRGNADTVVADLEQEFAVIGDGGGDPEIAAMRHGVNGIHGEGQEHLLDLRSVGANQRK